MPGEGKPTFCGIVNWISFSSARAVAMCSKIKATRDDWDTKNHLVTNMESRFPAMLVLWLEREFYRSKYEMTGSSKAWTPNLVDHVGDKFGDEIWDLKGAGIFSISLLGEDMRLNVLDDSM
ncbi:hypothetical protein AVEN_45092-1 [Araneus ventricosus]|uniref:Uncharacterized protein n=1 Tax=Araneus ventricosus TaxID=182803 RepID=A0A4Y2FSA7_ARAVE|nr:hypothetical protein AVEN_45092-1 [Araneus ventricosus]